MYKVFNKDYVFQLTENPIIFNETQFIDKLVFTADQQFWNTWKSILNKPRNVLVFVPDFSTFWTQIFKEYKEITAGGGLVFNENQELLIIFRRGAWDFPKGKADKGETIEQTAVREVEEECGVLPTIPENAWRKDTFHFYTEKQKKVLKRSVWFEMNATKTKLTPQLDEDIEKAEWVSIEEAQKRITNNSFASIQHLFNAYTASKQTQEI